MRVAIRVDASASIGLGHLKRCLSLAHALREVDSEILLLVANLDIDISSIVRVAGFTCVKIDSLPNSEMDAHLTIAALQTWHPEWVIVDHYGLDARWHTKVRQSLNARIAVIDDLANRSLAPDILIDHNFSVDHNEKYKTQLLQSTRILGGPRFALLGPTYRDVPPYRFHQDVQSIGIFMGGTDPINASAMVLEACREAAGFKGEIEVVTTSANPHLKSLTALCQQWPAISLLVDQDDLTGFFSRHDLQIGAGGGATWERCCMGVPTLALICAENQKVVVPALYRLGIVETVFSLSTAAIGEAIRTLIGSPAVRKHLSEASRHLVDGHGARRAALALMYDRLTVRLASSADTWQMYQWRNDPITRSTARDSREISWDLHEKWVERSLVNPLRHLLIAQIGRHPVGIIRFDLRGAEAEVSLYLDPTLQGLGLGTKMLQAGEVSALARWKELEVFVAETLEHNVGSRRLFEAAGYGGSYHHFRKTVRGNALH